MKHTCRVLGVAILCAVMIACGATTQPQVRIGHAVGPFVFTVAPASNSLTSFQASNTGGISPVTSVATGQAPSALVLQSHNTFENNLYVADSASNTLDIFRVDPDTGMLARSAPSIAVGLRPVAIALQGASGNGSTTPVDRGTIYVLNEGSNSVSAFRILDNAGNMAEVPGSPVATLPNPQAIAVVIIGNPNPQIAPLNLVYVANGTLGTISAFKVNADGSLAQLANSPFKVGTNVTALAGRFNDFLFAADDADRKLIALKVDQATGALTASGTAATGIGPAALTTSGGRFVYVVNRGDNTVSGYSFDALTGALAALPGTPVATGSNPVAVTFTQREQLYVANAGSSDISGFNVDSNTGALTPIAGSPFHMDTPPRAVESLFIRNVD